MRLIDADALEQVLDDRAEILKNERTLYGEAAVVTVLDKFAPTIYAVPIDSVLEIIDEEIKAYYDPRKYKVFHADAVNACRRIGDRVKALKGGYLNDSIYL